MTTETLRRADPEASRRGASAWGPLRLLVLATALVAPSGCGEVEEKEGFSRKPVTVDALPAPVGDAAKKALPGIKFDDAWQNLDRQGNLLSYEVKGRAANGKIREVRVSPSGEILEME